MFTCKPENEFAVYMIFDRTTRRSYIGASTNVAARLNGHEIRIRLRTGKSGTDKRIMEAFPNILDVEFRILEFIPPQTCGRDAHHNRVLRRKKLRAREHAWIHQLRPTLNGSVDRPIVSIEDLPYGAPEPHNTGATRQSVVAK